MGEEQIDGEAKGIIELQDGLISGISRRGDILFYSGDQLYQLQVGRHGIQHIFHLCIDFFGLRGSSKPLPQPGQALTPKDQ